MPASYAHYRFGTAQLAAMPADVRKTIGRFRSLFDMGLHGPDIFYYSRAVIPSGKDFLGIKYHEQTGREFFTRVCRAVRLERSEAALSYLYGVLCHYCLDSVCHPVIAQITEGGTVGHMVLETEFDRYLLETDGKVPAWEQDLSPHIRLTEGECETVSRFYPAASASRIRRHVQSMAFLTRLMAAPQGLGRAALEKGSRLLPREIQGMLMHQTADADCVPCLPRLMDAYQAASAAFPAMLEQLREHMTYSAGFDSEFDRKFG